jgi:hypothetical protein
MTPKSDIFLREIVYRTKFQFTDFSLSAKARTHVTVNLYISQQGLNECMAKREEGEGGGKKVSR